MRFVYLFLMFMPVVIPAAGLYLLFRHDMDNMVGAKEFCQSLGMTYVPFRCIDNNQIGNRVWYSIDENEKIHYYLKPLGER